MPQFDFASFSVQIFWLIVSSFTFFLIYTRYCITSISKILKMREKLKRLSSFNKDKFPSLGYYDLAFHSSIIKSLFLRNKSK